MSDDSRAFELARAAVDAMDKALPGYAPEDVAYHYAMQAISRLMRLPDAAEDSTAGLLLSGLAQAVDEYEQMRWPLDRLPGGK